MSIADRSKVYTDTKIADLAGTTLDAITELDSANQSLAEQLSQKQDAIDTTDTYAVYPAIGIDGIIKMMPVFPQKNFLKGCDFSNPEALSYWTLSGTGSSSVTLYNGSIQFDGIPKCYHEGRIDCNRNAKFSQTLSCSDVPGLSTGMTLSMYMLGASDTALSSLELIILDTNNNVTSTLTSISSYPWADIFYTNYVKSMYSIAIYVKHIDAIAGYSSSNHLKLSFTTKNTLNTIFGIKLEPGSEQTLFYKPPDCDYPILIPQ